MELLFVGTGAADYKSPLSCTCENCTYIRTHGGRNLRHYSSLLVGGRVLLDCGPTAAWRLAELDVAPAVVEAVVFTHSHEDHLDVEALQALLRAREPARGPLPVYGNAAALSRLEAVPGLDCRLVRAGETIEAAGMQCSALRARHPIEGEETLVWVVAGEGRRFLYATDTAWPPDDALLALRQLQLDAVVAEATFGLLEESDYLGYMQHHMNWPIFGRLRQELLEAGTIAAATPFVATHLSLHWLPPHDQFSLLAEPPVAVAYDGMRLLL